MRSIHIPQLYVNLVFKSDTKTGIVDSKMETKTETEEKVALKVDVGY